LNAHKIETNHKNKRKRKYPAIWTKNEKNYCVIE
jgi:hypothetical protein